MAVDAVSHSELLGGANNYTVSAVPHEHASLTGPHKNSAELALVDVDTGSRIEKTNSALLTVRYLELLHVQLSRFSNKRLEPRVLEQKVFPF